MKTHTTHLLALLSFALLALLSGCASTQDRTPVTKDDILTALEITAALTIGDELRKAQTALTIVEDARRYVREGEQLTAEGAINYIAAKALEGSSLNAGEQLAVRRFVQRYQHNFALETDRVGLSPELLVTVGEALDSIEAVAREILDNGVAAPRSYAAYYDVPPAPAQETEAVGMGSNERSIFAQFLAFLTLEWIRGWGDDEPEQPDTAAAQPEPHGADLWSWLTSAETRQHWRAYYEPTDPDRMDRARKLAALEDATRADGSVDAGIYRRLAGLDTQPALP